ncbi:MAG: hypothetical protein NTY02_12400, partial [Acidobacteria bacterium]|nr:hypothetical protein [Acidobacteriota bacterium]
MEAVTSVLIERAHGDRGLPRMVTASLAAHVVLLAGLILVPAFRGPSPEQEVRPVMTVSLGGASGPGAGGMTMMGRPIQATVPLAEVRKPAPIRPPAAPPPEMTEPSPTARPVRTPPRTQTAPSPSPSAPAAAAVPAAGGTGKPGAAAVDPNRGLGFGGLSTGGGMGSGSYLD